MSKEMILMLHPTFGVLAMIAAVWVFVETLNAREANVGRIRTAGTLTAVLMWVTYIVGGYWYVAFYGADKALITSGPWGFAHSSSWSPRSICSSCCSCSPPSWPSPRKRTWSNSPARATWSSGYWAW